MPSSEPGRGIDASVAERISQSSGEPDWMVELRLKALRRFNEQSGAERSSIGEPEIDVFDLLDRLALDARRQQKIN